jgi:hypothetical protein
VQPAKCRLKGLEGVCEYVPDEEQQNPDREGVEELAQASPRLAEPAHGKPEQDGHAGDTAEE